MPSGACRRAAGASSPSRMYITMKKVIAFTFLTMLPAFSQPKVTGKATVNGHPIVFHYDSQAAVEVVFLQQYNRSAKPDDPKDQAVMKAWAEQNRCSSLSRAVKWELR